MKRYDLSEQQIEEALRKFPAVKDERSKAEILQNIELRSNRRRKREKRWIPAAAGAAAVLLFSILASSYLHTEQKSKDSAAIHQDLSNSSKSTGSPDSPAAPEIAEKSAEPAEPPVPERKEDISETSEKKTEDGAETVPKTEEGEPIEEEDESSPPLHAASALTGTLLSTEASEEKSFITIGVPDNNVNYVIPLTFEAEDGADRHQLFQLLLEKMNSLDEASLGLQDYYPLDLKMTPGSEERTVNVDFPADTNFSNLYEPALLRALEETFKYQGYSKILFSTGGSPGVELPETGYKTEEDILPHSKRPTFIYQADESKPMLLVPGNTEIDNIQDALKEMKAAEPQGSVAPSIPAGISIESAVEKGDKLELTFTSETSLKEDEENLRAIEAILLTAKEYGFSGVIFKSPRISKVGPYNLDEEVPVPAAPNLIH
ncbi:GerMN domain-containing protein [Peribacillus sp. SCS-37]|uniref:GerMN domain-containing protein n=1 Tax=Paraperibacillus esterisolvens TaxID=3115296 RepID=UPI003905A9C9